MPKHSEKIALPYSSAQMFDLVADVEKYPQFLPWCLNARITRRDGNFFWADLTVGYKFVRERFSSRVELQENKIITVKYLNGPMQNLSNRWSFEENDKGGCDVDFFIDFEFKNPIFKRIAGAFFEKAISRMSAAFRARAKVLYG